MKKSHILLTMFVAFSLLLAACGTTQAGSGTATVSGTEIGGGVTTETAPVGSTEVTTETAPVTGSTTETAPATGSMTETAPATGSTTETPVATSGTTGTQTANQSQDPGLLSNEMKFQVLDSQNNVLGQTSDLILDFANFKVAYVVVSLSQTNGSTTSQVAVPWNLLKVQAATTAGAGSVSTPSSTATTSSSTSATMGNPALGAFIYTGDAQLLAKAPAFDATTLPQLGQPAVNWDAAWVSYWAGGTAATATVTPTLSATLQPTVTSTPSNTNQVMPLQGVALASKVIGFSLMDSGNQPLGTLTDVVVDTNSGNLTYALVTVNNKLYVVPLQLLGMTLQNQSLVFMSTSQILQAAPSFDMGSFPNTTLSGWSAQIQSYWQTLVTPMTTSTP